MICTNTDHYVNSLSTTKKKKDQKKKNQLLSSHWNSNQTCDGISRNSYPAAGIRVLCKIESATTRIQPPEFESATG